MKVINGEISWILLWRYSVQWIQYMNRWKRIQAMYQIYTYGPIIHNEEVVKDLEQKGVNVLHSRRRAG